MQYEMKKEVAELAALTGMSEEDIGKKFDLFRGYIAQNRREQMQVLTAISEAKEKKAAADAKAAFEAKLEAGTAVWRKVSGEWMIQVTGQEVNVGDIVEVERKDGSKSKHVISKIATKTEEGTFCK